jgi:hypothetical protein
VALTELHSKRPGGIAASVMQQAAAALLCHCLLQQQHLPQQHCMGAFPCYCFCGSSGSSTPAICMCVPHTAPVVVHGPCTAVVMPAACLSACLHQLRKRYGSQLAVRLAASGSFWQHWHSGHCTAWHLSFLTNSAVVLLIPRAALTAVTRRGTGTLWMVYAAVLHATAASATVAS